MNTVWQKGPFAGLAVGLASENIDTDQLIPARFMSAPRQAGYGGFLLHDLRGPDFPLDAPAAQGAAILIAGRNFGCGSSREAAVYALVDAGFRAVIAPSFGDIFAANAVNNGLLPARADTAALLDGLPGPAAIDLPAQTIRAGGRDIGFDIDPVWKLKLLNGWDDIDLTARHRDQIAAFAQARRAATPWVWGASPTNRGPRAPHTGSDQR
jgi:3-isopropylmalate/(R)-2-methylmalate dehydratase small subunit